MDYVSRFSAKDGRIPFIADPNLKEYEVKIIGHARGSSEAVVVESFVMIGACAIWLRDGQDASLDLFLRAMFIASGCVGTEIRMAPEQLAAIESGARIVPEEAGGRCV